MYKRQALEQHRYTLLVVEDSLEMQAFVVKQLSSEYRVLTAVNGVEALKAVSYTHLKPAGDKIKTDWASQINPANVLPEYPRPIMEPVSYTHLLRAPGKAGAGCGRNHIPD